MSDGAIISWEEVYPEATQELRAWMGQTILYCEEQEARLDQ